jgi:hypothetical protein
MTRRMLYLTAVILLLPGCVLVTEPLSDPEKAEPDKRLLGKWELRSVRELGQWRQNHHRLLYEIDCPAVKGTPKGLMRFATKGFWFSCTPIGKHTYFTVYINNDRELADFGQEGDFEKWKKRKDRLYRVVLYVLEGNSLTICEGDNDKVKAVMEAEGIQSRLSESLEPVYKTPPGWLAKYLEKNGPGTLYEGKRGYSETWQRATELAKKVSQLAAALEDRSRWPDRYRAAVELGQLGPAAEDAVPALTAALKDPEFFVRYAAARALGQIGTRSPKALAALKAATKDEEQIVREAAAETYERLVGKPKKD